MKYMKLGSKPDAFQSEGSRIRYVESELVTDVVVNVGEVKFYLHKFPMLSKSNRLQRLVIEASGESEDEIHLCDFPGGPETFETCAKFCYGMAVTINPRNVAATRCAAEYLEMTEDVEKGNLIFKLEVFLDSCMFRSWKDSITVLQTTECLLPWSDDLKVAGRCIDSITSKTSTDPSNVSWSYTYSKRFSSLGNHQKAHNAPKDWWVEDLCELDMGLYRRVMVAIKAKGRMSSEAIGEALRAYAARWLPDSFEALVSGDDLKRNRSLVETIVCLLPSDMRSGCSCSFLLKLLRVALLVGVGDLPKEELMGRISMQLHNASVKDLLIPAARSQSEGTVYDVDLVRDLVKRRTSLDGSGDGDGDGDDIVLLADASLLALGKLVDGYLGHVASDPDLQLSSFMDLSTSIPAAARPLHDGLYSAIDMYLKEHASLSKAEKKGLCSLIDAKKLSADASADAAQNERLPLRTVVQVIFFGQVRSAAASSSRPAAAPTNGTMQDGRSLRPSSSMKGDEGWKGRMPAECGTPKRQLPPSQSMVKFRGGQQEKKSEEDRPKRSVSKNASSTSSGGRLLPSRSRRIFDRLWAKNRSSETSGSSKSPPLPANPGEGNSSGSSSRHRRHSIS